MLSVLSRAAVSVNPRASVTPLSVSLEALKLIFTGSPTEPKALSAFTFTVTFEMVTGPISPGASRFKVPPPLIMSAPTPATVSPTFSVSPVATCHVWSAFRKSGQPSVYARPSPDVVMPPAPSVAKKSPEDVNANAPGAASVTPCRFAARSSDAAEPAEKVASSVPPVRSGRTVLPTSPQLAALPTVVSEPPFAVQVPVADPAAATGRSMSAPPTHTYPPPVIQPTAVAAPSPVAERYTPAGRTALLTESVSKVSFTPVASLSVSSPVSSVRLVAWNVVAGGVSTVNVVSAPPERLSARSAVNVAPLVRRTVPRVTERKFVVVDFELVPENTNVLRASDGLQTKPTPPSMVPVKVCESTRGEPLTVRVPTRYPLSFRPVSLWAPFTAAPVSKMQSPGMERSFSMVRLALPAKVTSKPGSMRDMLPLPWAPSAKVPSLSWT